MNTGNENKGTDGGVNFQDILAQLGLVSHIIDADGGKQAASTIITALGRLMDLAHTSSEQRVELAAAILNWQVSALPQHRKDGFKKGYFKLFYTIEYILCQPDDEIISDYKYGMQIPAVLLTQMFAQECQTNSLAEMGEPVLIAYVELLSSLLDSKMQLVENATINTVHNPVSARVLSVGNLIRCVPKEVDTTKQLKLCLDVLFRVLHSCDEAPLLKNEVFRRIQLIGLDLSVDSNNSNNNGGGGGSPGKSQVWLEHIPDLLAAVKEGHSEFRALVMKNKALFSIKSQAIEDYLSDIVETLGFDELEDLLQDLADFEPRKLVKALPSFVHQLAGAALKHKYLILGILLAVALVLGAAPLSPLLGGVTAVCSAAPELFIPFFKLLTSLAPTGGDDLAMHCLSIVAKIAKSGLVTSPANQAALLETINILKDSCKYSNLFSADTLKVLQGFAASNPAVFKNIVTWNAGKSAKKGNQKDFLITAGQSAASCSTTTGTAAAGTGAAPQGASGAGSASTVSARSVGLIARWFSPKKAPPNTPAEVATSDATNSSSAMSGTPQSTAPPLQLPTSPPPTYVSPGPVKASSVAPSPQSQNTALLHLQQQLAAQQQQLHQQMLLMQQLQYQEQIQLMQMQQQQQQGVVPVPDLTPATNSSNGTGAYQFLVPMSDNSQQQQQQQYAAEGQFNPTSTPAGLFLQGAGGQMMPLHNHPQLEQQQYYQQYQLGGQQPYVSPTGMLYLNPPQTPSSTHYDINPYGCGTYGRDNGMNTTTAQLQQHPYQLQPQQYQQQLYQQQLYQQQLYQPQLYQQAAQYSQYPPSVHQQQAPLASNDPAGKATHTPAKQLFPADDHHHHPNQERNVHWNDRDKQSTDREPEEVLSFTENRTHTRTVGPSSTPAAAEALHTVEKDKKVEDSSSAASHLVHLGRCTAVAPAETTTTSGGGGGVVGAVVQRLRRAPTAHPAASAKNSTITKVVQVTGNPQEL